MLLLLCKLIQPQLQPQQVVDLARAAAPAGSIATIDSGAHMLPATVLWPVDEVNEMGLRCQAKLLLDFFRVHDADTIYLVGDIVDGWALKSNWYWPMLDQNNGRKTAKKTQPTFLKIP